MFSQIPLKMYLSIYLLKVKRLSIGIFYRPPNVNTFLETFLNDLKIIDFKKLTFIFF